jgi:hypothetical protein
LGILEVELAAAGPASSGAGEVLSCWFGESCTGPPAARVVQIYSVDGAGGGL